MSGELTSSSCASSSSCAKVGTGCDELLRFPEGGLRTGCGCDVVIDAVLHIVCLVGICIAHWQH